jgi:hypothetical protein
MLNSTRLLPLLPGQIRRQDCLRLLLNSHSVVIQSEQQPPQSELLQKRKKSEEHRSPIASLVLNIDAAPYKLFRRHILLMHDRI